MTFRTRLLLGLSFIVLAGHTSMAAQTLPPVAHWLPVDTLIVLELSQPKALLNPLLDAKVREAVAALPAYKKLTEKAEYIKVRALVALLEGILGTNWHAGLKELTGGGITVALGPKDAAVLVIDAEDEIILQKLHNVWRDIVQAEANKQGQTDRTVSREIQGGNAWSFDGKEAHAIIGKRFLIANQIEALKAVLALRDGTAGPGLAGTATFQNARKTAGPDAAAFLFLNLGILKQAPALAQSLKDGRQNPLAAMFFSGIIDGIRESTWLATTLSVEKESIVLRTLMDGKNADPTGLTSFARPAKSDEGVLPNLVAPRQIAGFSFYRDLHRFYAAKDKLFPERTSGLIFFENMMGIFFSGRDLTDDVLGQPKPDIRFVVAEQKYNPAIGTPQIRLPGFAAIFRLKNPAEYDEVFEEAWQKALGLINFTRGQQALPGLIIDRPTHREVTFTASHFSSVSLKDRTNLPPRFNYRPAIAMTDEYLVLSSTDDLARDLIDSIKQEKQAPIRPVSQIHSLVEMNGSQLNSILEANRETFVQNNMLQGSKTQEEARGSVDLALTLAKTVKNIKLSIGEPNGATEARLEIRVALP